MHDSSDDDPGAGDDERPSKSERKRRSDDLQSLGEALIDLPQSELDALPLPDALRDAVMVARRITAHGGLYRQKQYIGKLMRKLDAEPIRAAMTARNDRQRLEALRFRRIEHWRDRLLAEGDAALAQFIAETAGRVSAQRLRGLVADAQQEQRSGAAPHAARELFRAIRSALDESAPQ
jgi:ribosome-associated protein